MRLDEFLPYRLSFTSNLVSGAIAQTYEALFGISIPEWRIIAWVAEEGAMTQMQVGQRTRMDKVTVSRASIALTQRGLLKRTANPLDGRSHLLALSSAGEKLYGEIAPMALRLEAEVLADFNSEEVDQLKSMLKRIDGVVLARPSRIRETG